MSISLKKRWIPTCAPKGRPLRCTSYEAKKVLYIRDMCEIVCEIAGQIREIAEEMIEGEPYIVKLASNHRSY